MTAPTINNPNLIRQGAFINGEWVNEAAKRFDVTDPANEQKIADLPDQDLSVVDEAIEAASEAFKTYKKTTPRQRAQWLRNLFDLMNENVEDLAKIITWENGKALAEARGEVKYAASYFEWFAEEAPRIYGKTIQPSNPANRVFTIYQPVGVCGIITPWNFPSAMITRKAAAALAAGCTLVIKPDSQTPLSALAVAYLADQAGFPKGVFNVVLTHTQTPAFGLRLCEHKKVKKISFTGSTNVGKILMNQSASTLKKLSMELGGNAPVIIFKDADLDKAVQQALASKFRGLGQTCVCANRIYVERDVLEEFETKFSEEVKKFVVGHGLKDTTTHGALINDRAVAKVEEHIEDAISKGAKVVVRGGKRADLGPNFYEPAVLSNVDSSMKVTYEETFGPLGALIPFDNVDEVIEAANNVDVGLAAYVFSNNINTIYKVSEGLEFGMVSCNTGVFSDATTPFGGVKESGFGREGSYLGVFDYLVVKSVIHSVDI